MLWMARMAEGMEQVIEEFDHRWFRSQELFERLWDTGVIGTKVEMRFPPFSDILHDWMKHGVLEKTGGIGPVQFRFPAGRRTDFVAWASASVLAKEA